MKQHKSLFCLLLALILLFGSAVPAFAAHPFTDVPAGKWYSPYVEYVYENGLMNGTSDTAFAPNTNMSRSMVVTVLHRLAGSPAASAKLPFTDVPSGKYFTEPVRWSYEEGIVNGTSDTAFSPNTNITREQLVTIFYRYAQSKGLDTSARANLTAYADQGRIGNFAKDAFKWAVSCGIINGTSDTALSPKGNATRAQCATILQRFISWMNGDPAMPSGAVLVAVPKDFSRYIKPPAELNLKPSISSGLLQLPNGDYQTTDGRLTVSPDAATCLVTYSLWYGGEVVEEYSSIHHVFATYRPTDRIILGPNGFVDMEYAISTAVSSESISFCHPADAVSNTLVDYWDWTAMFNSSHCSRLDQEQKSSDELKVRLMLVSDSAIVYYVYYQPTQSGCNNFITGEFITDPFIATMEALIAISPSSFEYDPGEDWNDNDGDNTDSPPDHDNDYGSALSCTACGGSGDCSKCGGDGKIHSSASDKEDRNCTKCNASGRCTTCGGSGKRYN